MKNQFFADKHDYFKYDLWLQIAEAEQLKRLTFIPMLTPNDVGKEGRRISYEVGNRRKRLYCFHQFCLVPNRRSVARLHEFLCDEPFEYHPYRDEDDKGFQDGSWNAYLGAVPREWLEDAAVLLDPDTGLQTDGEYWKKAPEKYITYDNVSNLVGRCSRNSVVIIFQFLQKKAGQREADLNGRSATILHGVGSDLQNYPSVHWISERTSNGLGDLAFFIIGTGPDRADALDHTLRNYARRHGLSVRQVKAAQEIHAQ